MHAENLRSQHDFTFTFMHFILYPTLHWRYSLHHSIHSLRIKPWCYKCNAPLFELIGHSLIKPHLISVEWQWLADWTSQCWACNTRADVSCTCRGFWCFPAWPPAWSISLRSRRTFSRSRCRASCDWRSWPREWCWWPLHRTTQHNT